VYELLSGIDPRHAGRKVLQPYIFKDPLAASLTSQTEFQQVAWRLQALSCITTPTEFAGMVFRQVDRSDLKRWRFWLTTLSTPECYNNLPKAHLVALFPLFADQIRRFGDTAKTLETPEGEAFYRFKKIMRDEITLPAAATEAAALLIKSTGPGPEVDQALTLISVYEDKSMRLEKTIKVEDGSLHIGLQQSFPKLGIVVHHYDQKFTHASKSQ
jgi:hypothetical protein